MKPFLKWAGGKYRLVPKISELLPKGSRLIEPFVGAGSVFLNTDYDNYLLADTNADLINLFQLIKTEKNGFIEYARTLFCAENNTEASFYELRNEFNTSRDERRKAALFIYLNKHCFNGLCRYNAKGGFNVPYGRYKRPSFPELEILDFLTQSEKADFITADFVHTMELAKVGDVVYCDPPYVPLNATSHFTSYSAGGFSAIDQSKLAEMAFKLQSKGITVLISNHNTEETQSLYKKEGVDIAEFDVQRSISCDGKNRNKAKELLALFN